jgi:exopolysaccharide biosynthesis polyprenyl glycosylphosphotransferase
VSPARKQIRFVVLTVLLDTLTLTASFFLSYAVRFTSGLIPIAEGAAHPETTHYVKALSLVIPVYLWMFRTYGLYATQRHIRRIEEIFSVMRAVTYSILILTAATFFYRGFSYSRVYLVVLWVLSIFFISVGRYFLIQWEYRRKVQKKDLTKVLIVGANRNARSIIKWAKSNPHYGQEVVAVLARDTALIGKHLEGITIIGAAEECENHIAQIKPERVVLVDQKFSRDEITDLVAACEDSFIDFKVTADFYGLMTRSVDIENISSVPLLGFRALPLDDFWNRCVKRTFDFLVALAAMILTLPFWILAVILIKSDDRGPLFYVQERVGRDKKVFKVLKFRTMRVDAEKETGPVWARPNDNRRTRFGNFLRRFNIDELPQILNVLKGEMSLVGPRPERPHFVSQFRETIPRYMARHKIKSGITGWAQVNGFRGNTSIRERLKYDLYYMENWSLLLDVEILFMTVFTFKAYKNAY